MEVLEIAARRGTEVRNIHELARRWDVFYEASHDNLDEVFELFKERCVREGYEFEKQSFVWRNKIRAIVQKRAEAIPTSFNVSVKEEVENAEAVEEWLSNWLDGPHFGDGRNIWQALRSWNLWLERHGNLILKLSLVDGVPVVSRVSVLNADMYLDPEDYSRVYAWEFSWVVEAKAPRRGVQTRRIVEYVDSEIFRRYEDGELVREDRHSLGFIPVVHVTNGITDGVWGRSVIEDLIEPQIMLAAVMSTIREVNRWAGWPAFAGDIPLNLVDLRPGGYTVDASGSLRAITWNVDIRSLLEERDSYLQDLYEAGRVAPKTPEAISATGHVPSGKALLILTQDGIQYIETVVSLLEEGMAELLYKAAAMAGVLPYDPHSNPIVVSYPPLKLEDEDVKLSRAKVLIEAYARGLLPKRTVIQALMDLDLFEAEGVDAVLNELEAEGGSRGSGVFSAGLMGL